MRNHTRRANCLPTTTWCWMVTLSFLFSAAAAAFNASELPPIKPPPYPPNPFADDPLPDLKWVQEAAFFAWQIYDVPIINGTSLDPNPTLVHKGDVRSALAFGEEGYSFPITAIKTGDATLSIVTRYEPDERGPPLLLVSIKGTESLHDWLINVDAVKPSKFGPADRPIYDSGEWAVNVHNGYNRIFDRPNVVPVEWIEFLNTLLLNSTDTNYTLTVNENSTLYDVVEDVLDALMSLGIFDRVSFTGHSKGGAQAQLMAGYYAVTHPSVKVDVMTMGAPKQGNAAYKLLLEGLDNLRMFRFVYGTDLVARVPTPGLVNLKTLSNESENFHHAGHLIWNRYPLTLVCGAKSIVEAYYRDGENLPPDSDYATLPEDFVDASLGQILSGKFAMDHFRYDTWLLGGKRFVWPFGPAWKYTGYNYPTDYVRSGGVGADDGKYPFPRMCLPAGIIVRIGTLDQFYAFLFTGLAILGLTLCICVIVVIIGRIRYFRSLREAREKALQEGTSETQRQSDISAEKKEFGQEPEDQSAEGPTSHSTVEDEESGKCAHDYESKQIETQPTSILPTGELMTGSIENRVNQDEGEA